jgi:hypothetical protein
VSSPVFDGVGFRDLELHGWRQFDHVELQFHPRLTVITGANAAGKTTILHLLASHFGWQAQFVGTPAPKRRGGALSFLSGFWRRRQGVDAPGAIEVGHVGYTTGHVCALQIPEEQGSAAFNVSYSAQQPVPGLFIPSHRPTFVYQQVSQIPTVAPTRQQLFDNYLNEVRGRYYATPGSGYSPAYRLKEALIALALFGEGNSTVEPNPEALAIYRGFVEILRRVLPPSLGFEDLSVRMPEVVMVTRTGDFSFDAVSGGVASIVDLAFQIYMRGQDEIRFAVVIDEPENHLHPELQRSLLPGFLDAFPNVQFIVATHNPFIVGSVSDSNVYVLRYRQVEDVDLLTFPSAQHRVSSVLLETANKAGSSNEILREVLGVPGTRGLWVENRVGDIISRYSHRKLDEPTLQALYEDFANLGLEDVFPDNAEQLLNRDQTD